jgi:UDP-galactopyranose mutase
LFKRYDTLAQQQEDVTFVGRLAQYRYYNMDQCVGAALKAADVLAARLGKAHVSSVEGVRAPLAQDATPARTAV